MNIMVKVPVYPTESEKRVREAVENIFPGANLAERDAGDSLLLEGTAPDLDRFTELLARQKIRDTARAFLMRRVRGNKLSFSLNKQAAFAGRINFIEGGQPPLGCITVTIEHDEPERMIEKITHIPVEVIGGGAQ